MLLRRAVTASAVALVLLLSAEVRAADQNWSNSVPGSNFTWSNGLGNWNPYN